jgi:hypothetical protein
LKVLENANKLRQIAQDNLIRFKSNENCVPEHIKQKEPYEVPRQLINQQSAGQYHRCYLGQIELFYQANGAREEDEKTEFSSCFPTVETKEVGCNVDDMNETYSTIPYTTELSVENVKFHASKTDQPRHQSFSTVIASTSTSSEDIEEPEREQNSYEELPLLSVLIDSIDLIN